MKVIEKYFNRYKKTCGKNIPMLELISINKCEIILSLIRNNECVTPIYT